MLLQLQERRDELSALGADVIGVSKGADFQADELRDDDGVTYPLLVDPEESLKGALRFRRMRPWQYLVPSTLGRYVASLRHARPGKITGDVLALPGVVVIDGDRRLRYRYEGRTLADYPELDEVIAAVAAI
ncbi:MAG: AhpC/TSA family protein [Actinomycetota bacterium]